MSVKVSMCLAVTTTSVWCIFDVTGKCILQIYTII